MAQMKLSEAKEITRNMLGLAMAKNRDKIVALLKKHGIAIDKSFTDDQIIVATLVGIRESSKFRSDLQPLLADTALENTSSFTAEYNTFFFTGANNFFNQVGEEAKVTTTEQKQKTAIGSLLADKDTLKNVLNTGLNVLSTSLTSKSNKELADKALQIEQEKTKQAALAAQGAGAGKPSPGKKGWSTTTIVIVAVISVGGIALLIWAFSKKKK